MKKIIFIVILLMLVPYAQAAANLEVTAFSCNPDEVVISNQFSCTATVQNTGDATGSLNTATLYPDATSWTESASYAKTVNTNINSGASTEVVFTGLKGKKSGNNGFTKIMLDDVTDSYVEQNAIKVNVINVVGTVTASASSAAQSATVDVTGQATSGGNVDITLTFSVSSGGCSIGNQQSTATSNEMTDGQTTSHTWTVTMGSANCAYSVSAAATSNPSGTATKTDTTTGTITCSNCDDGGGGTTSSGGGGGSSGGGAIGGAAVTETQTIALIAAGATGTFSFTKSEQLAVTEIKVEAKNTVSSASITLTESSKPASAPLPIESASGSVYKYIEITAKNIKTEDINKAYISFSIPKTWISTNTLDPNTVALNRLKDNTWTKLATTKVSEDATNYHYNAETPGFSIFAITAEKKKAEEKPAEEKPVEEKPPVKAEEKLPELQELVKDYRVWIAIVFALISIIAIFGYIHHHKKK